jgi:hypothetical protein
MHMAVKFETWGNLWGLEHNYEKWYGLQGSFISSHQLVFYFYDDYIAMGLRYLL